MPNAPWTLYDVSLKPSLNLSVLKKNSLSTFQKVMMKTDGTVTDLVALYTGDIITVNVLRQQRISELPTFLDLSSGDSVLRRIVLLQGKENNYVYAESLFVFNRLSDYVQQKLVESDSPIGLLWKQEKFECYREILDVTLERNDRVANYFNESDDSEILSRTYAIYTDKRILGIITEKFPISIFK
ncbi:chorismate pyruvate-lyase family protein [Chryseobacterium sp. BIGb0232]|uniref:chorismate pyruvate-lyase family protein n=1 Tax=Chryseobacterium sp. BIGb0232 TaxID=2940598 RepID=UPI00161BAEBD|nr:chorismate pyruvate-lyase family protein [Chryseobacterium sp. BIGb0232]MCS4304853.1 chorismate-pyruvate lyase [Chryseobacterium sp. BIGb0232]